jgi:hypothetical protein
MTFQEEWLAARTIIAEFLEELCPNETAEVLEHNAAIIARLAHHEPPLLITASDGSANLNCPHFGDTEEGYGIDVGGYLIGLCGDCQRALETQVGNVQCDRRDHDGSAAGDVLRAADDFEPHCPRDEDLFCGTDEPPDIRPEVEAAWKLGKAVRRYRKERGDGVNS